MNSIIKVSDNAANRIKEIMAKEFINYVTKIMNVVLYCVDVM